ncbi:hypothetical protein [Photobacterium sp. TY1-4]|uniref:hypothetical protein n=1 Tax=Photobacterium sp. TY1-4 TaxID=2899122 RepID=UPI0021BF7470|nr:hypothetical protein [Photobacterium sp. TY1-4]UXI03384.1 hypothetical protein NH461_23455 [Photobacterium sp. TY1-4]
MKKTVVASLIASVFTLPAMAGHYDGFTDDNRGWGEVNTSGGNYEGEANTYFIYTQDEMKNASSETQIQKLTGGVGMAQSKAK